MTTVLKRATQEQKDTYLDTRPIYPLYGYLHVDGKVLAVEDLRSHWNKEDPQYEVMAPSGFHFSESMTHTRLEFSLKDVRANADSYSLSPCVPGCGCGCVKDDPQSTEPQDFPYYQE